MGSIRDKDIGEDVVHCVTKALNSGTRALFQNPTLLVPALLMALIRSVQYTVIEVEELLLLMGGVLFFVEVFFFSGLFSTFATCSETKLSFKLSFFFQGGRSHYRRFLLAYPLFLAISYPFRASLSIFSNVVHRVFISYQPLTYPQIELFGFPITSPSDILVLMVFLSITGIPVFFVQLYAPAIVLEDQGVLNSFGRSLRIVRANPSAIVAYSATALTIFLIASTSPIQNFTSPLLYDLPKIVFDELWRYFFFTLFVAYQVYFYQNLLFDLVETTKSNI